MLAQNKIFFSIDFLELLFFFVCTHVFAVTKADVTLPLMTSGGSWWKWPGGLRNFISGWTYRIVALAVFIISGVSSHSSSPNLVKFVIFSCPYWYCCNLSGGVALIVWFTTNGMRVKNNTIHICGANKQ